MFESLETEREVHKIIARSIQDFLEKHKFSSTMHCSILEPFFWSKPMRFGSFETELNENTQQEDSIYYFNFRVYINERFDNKGISEIDW